MQLGDKNTQFFHSAAKARTAKNQIRHLITEDGVAISDTDTVKTMAPAYYEALFNQIDYSNVFPKVTVKRKLTTAAAD